MTATRPSEVPTERPPAAPSALRRLLPGAPGSGTVGGSTLLRHLIVAVLAGTAVVLLTNQLPPYQNLQVARVGAFLCVTAGYTVLVGLNGQLSLGHGALMATGAYTVALVQQALADRAVQGRWILPLSLLLAAGVTAAVGLAIGLAAARLRGPYLAGVTLAVATLVPAITTIFTDVFNGEQGLRFPAETPPASLGAYFQPERWLAWVALLAALVTMVLMANLVRSRFGRSLRAVRDDEVAARLAGIPVARTQVLAFVVSAACAGLGGGVYAVLTGTVAPGKFALELSLFLLMAIVIGGLGSLAGAVWGAVLLVALQDLPSLLTETFTLPSGLARRLEGNLALAVFGLTLVVVMLAAPGGLQGAARDLLARLGARRRHPSR
ncbi:branched-chain amino acid ABC transporter permease [Micromonospora mirobrigensis]|uniref:Amino acid/amide ABC transporter membrane protein 2, HAAT family (TC 3.A.1.4.-) n=1 Tax=Micromonospora mirobrigensis TaxID=262898 RepID=A0A1C4YL94_9ACTN|nr:branched-chain amino acid ABC transporter permease [Micromonospora mirobrigensis]SCF21430.1 amino acid/amide ABC transporter membrane protein 2, HAAT family (TC 3.A.1.4.-) [Micromonospora mirobrigensis]